MTVFARKPAMNVSEWGPVQDLIGELQIKLGEPHDLMMFSVDTSGRLSQDIYIGLPNDTLLRLFPGFEKVAQQSLPDYLTTLVVREDKFAELFPDIARKRRIRRD